jgi:hypothetical protein
LELAFYEVEEVTSWIEGNSIVVPVLGYTVEAAPCKVVDGYLHRLFLSLMIFEVKATLPEATATPYLYGSLSYRT